MGLSDLAAGPKRARILTIDIETRPITAHVWGLWDQRVGLNQIVDAGGVICFAAKWYGEREVLFHSDHADGHEAMIRAAHNLLSEADFVVHYNGQRFDIPHLNREFAQMGILPPRPFRQVDLLRTARSQFKFPSNKLDHVAGALGLGHKKAHQGFALWTACMAGDERAWRVMAKYNEQDVRLTERLYVKLRPWIKGHPNMALYIGDDGACSNCGSKKRRRDGSAFTAQTEYAQFVCTGCGAWLRTNYIKNRSLIRTVR